MQHEHAAASGGAQNRCVAACGMQTDTCIQMLHCAL